MPDRMPLAPHRGPIVVPHFTCGPTTASRLEVAPIERNETGTDQRDSEGRKDNEQQPGPHPAAGNRTLFQQAPRGSRNGETLPIAWCVIDPEGFEGVDRVLQAIAIMLLLFLVLNVVAIAAVMAWSKRTHRSRRGLVFVLTAVALISTEASSVIAYLMLTGDQEDGWIYVLLLAVVAVAAAGAVAKWPKEASP